MSTGSFLLDVGVSANYLIHTPQKTAEAEGGLVIGVNAGYTFAPGTPKWELDGINSVSGGPSVKLQGFHVRFAFGGWSRKPHQ